MLNNDQAATDGCVYTGNSRQDAPATDRDTILISVKVAYLHYDLNNADMVD